MEIKTMNNNLKITIAFNANKCKFLENKEK